VADLTLQTLIEFRAEMRDFRDEARKSLAQHEHRLNLLAAEGQTFRGEMLGFRDEMLGFRDEMLGFRDEMLGFRDETRRSLGQHEHRLSVLAEQTRDQSTRLAQLETHMAALLATMPHVHTRIDDLAARLAAVEARVAALP
jgi:chromosome segregation ATPase